MGFCVEYPKNTISGHHPHLQRIKFVRNLAQRSKEHFGILYKSCDYTQGNHTSTNGIQLSIPNHQSSGHCSCHLRNGKENRVVPNRPDPRLSVVGIYFLKSLVFSFFTGKNLNYFHPRNPLLYKSVQIGNLVPNVLKSSLHGLLENPSGV